MNEKLVWDLIPSCFSASFIPQNITWVKNKVSHNGRYQEIFREIFIIPVSYYPRFTLFLIEVIFGNKSEPQDVVLLG